MSGRCSEISSYLNISELSDQQISGVKDLEQQSQYTKKIQDKIQYINYQALKQPLKIESKHDNHIDNNPYSDTDRHINNKFSRQNQQIQKRREYGLKNHFNIQNTNQGQESNKESKSSEQYQNNSQLNQSKDHYLQNPSTASSRQYTILSNKQFSNINYLTAQTNQLIKLTLLNILKIEQEQMKKKIIQCQIKCRKLRISLRSQSYKPINRLNSYLSRESINKSKYNKISKMKLFTFQKSIDNLLKFPKQDPIHTQILLKKINLLNKSKQQLRQYYNNKIDNMQNQIELSKKQLEIVYMKIQTIKIQNNRIKQKVGKKNIVRMNFLKVRLADNNNREIFKENVQRKRRLIKSGSIKWKNQSQEKSQLHKNNNLQNVSAIMQQYFGSRRNPRQKLSQKIIPKSVQNYKLET